MLFLTPFVLVGIGTFITAMCASFGRQEVTVGAGRGGIFFGVGGIGWTRRFDPSMVTRIDVKKSMVKRNEDTVRQIEIEAEKTYTLGSHMCERRKVWVCAELKRRFLGAGGA